MARYKALKTFRVSDTGEMVEPGKEFDTEIKSYESRGLAVPVGGTAKRTPKKQTTINKAADTGPLASRGGRTGAVTSQSLSRPVRVQQTRRSRKSKAEQE